LRMNPLPPRAAPSSRMRDRSIVKTRIRVPSRGVDLGIESTDGPPGIIRSSRSRSGYTRHLPHRLLDVAGLAHHVEIILPSRTREVRCGLRGDHRLPRSRWSWPSVIGAG
jgi:hypothetical protein